MMMSGETVALPQGWGKERDPMSLRLVTAENHPDFAGERDSGPSAGILVGVFCGSMFWLGLGIGWALWG